MNAKHGLWTAAAAAAVLPTASIASAATIGPDADSFIRSAGTTGAGDKTTLEVYNPTTSGGREKVYIRFNLADASASSGGVQSVSLTLHIVNSGQGNLGSNQLGKLYTFNIYGLKDGYTGGQGERWAEDDTLIWATAPGNDNNSSYALLSSASYGGAPLFSFTIAGKGTGTTLTFDSTTLSTDDYTNLLNFVNDDSGSNVGDGLLTFVIGRVTQASGVTSP